MGKLDSKFDRWSSRGANLAAFWPLIPAGLVGIVTGILAKGVALLSQFGPFGWWAAGLVGFAMAALGIFGIAGARLKWASARAIRKWSEEVDDINPLDREFTRLRIKVQDLVHPNRNTISGKRFVECELYARANLVFRGDMHLQGVNFMHCDFVIIHDPPLIIQNTVIMENCILIDGELWNATIFVTQEMFDMHIRPLRPNLISFEKPVARDA